MIVDVHSHVFPHLGDERYGTVRDKLIYFQRHVIWHQHVSRRLSDGAPAQKHALYDGRGTGIGNMLDVNFRVGECGRFLYTYEGEDYYVQWIAPTFQRLEASPEMILAEMDNVGVRKGVISRGHTYGKLNDYLGEVIRKYPDRFVGTCEIEEWRAYEDSQIQELHRCVQDLGLRGLFFDGAEAFFHVDNRERYDSEKFAPFWEEVRALGIPVMWSIYPQARPGPEDFLERLATLGRFARRHADIPMVFTHGFSMRLLPEDKLTKEVIEFCRIPNMHLELLFPTTNYRTWEYPYPEAQEIIKVLYHEVGPHKLMWGSDLPHGRACTYRQSLDYLRMHCSQFIAPQDMDAILGGNAATMFGL